MCWKHTDAYGFDVFVCTIKFQHTLNAPEHERDKNTDRCKFLEYLFVCERKPQKLVFSGAEAARLAKTFTNPWRWAYLNHFPEQASWSFLMPFGVAVAFLMKKILSSQHVQECVLQGTNLKFVCHPAFPGRVVSPPKALLSLPTVGLFTACEPCWIWTLSSYCPTQWRNGDSHRCFGAHMGMFNISDNF